MATTTWRVLTACMLVVSSIQQIAAQTAASPTITSAPQTNSTSRSPTGTSAETLASAPDVYLNVPTLHVGRIELDVDNLNADINLNAKVAQLVSINAGVQVGINKVNLTIADVDAELELVVRLGHLVDIVNRVFESLDINPSLINTLNNVTSDVTGLLDEVVGEVDGLLGSITQGGNNVRFVVDNLGNIVQTVNNSTSTIVGNYAQNMTFTGDSKSVGSGLTQKTYSYSPLKSLVDIVFNKAGQIVQATVQKSDSGNSSSSASGSATASRSATASASTATGSGT
ncbi:hypothetical protein KC318_g2770 [Hortaea werneckii]|uniref:Uncharacterized protein n=1 Tax=Hortaea werneckii TaxID=91943 RepID=A0A3M7BIY3_HORWE|nr:hypothetical protein KC334_g4816 [Hortaea werneckii]KAI7011072.1 hypothetical protein KC355_g5909 [Hortaea werneckii]KAI7202161.1 hypothetical protein KC324_g1872 [Hortaea werneckii]KAI7589016.1 hypothetical protein KC316_g4165 [Hortaea werneckii]KAI7672598.1 hypothetical protein KC318_g2770 [Hortaea werneckii]